MKSLKLNKGVKSYIIINVNLQFSLKMQREEYRSVIKFLYLNGNSEDEILRSLQNTYGQNALSRTTVFNWIREAKWGREGVQDAPRPGRPCSVVVDANVRLVEKLVLEVRRITTEQLEEITGILTWLTSLHFGGRLGLQKSISEMGTSNA